MSSNSQGQEPQLNTDMVHAMAQYGSILIVSSIAFGAHMIIAASTLRALIRRRKRPFRTPHIAFISTLLLLGTINFAYFILGAVQAMLWTISTGMAAFGNIPGSFVTSTENWGQDIPAVLVSTLGQSYFLFRCYVIWDRKRIIPFMFGPLVLFMTALDTANTIFRGKMSEDPTYNFGRSLMLTEILPRICWTLSIAFNVTVTSLIVGRLSWMRSKIRSALGDEFAKMHTGMAAMVYESSIVYTLVVISCYMAIAGPIATGNMFSPLLVQTQCIASELITLRFALGRAYSDDTTHALTKAGNRESFTRLVDRESMPYPLIVPEGSQLKKQDTFASSSSNQTRTISLFPSSVASVLSSYRRSRDRDSIPPPLPQEPTQLKKSYSFTSDSSHQTRTISLFPSSVASVLESHRDEASFVSSSSVKYS